MRKLVLTRTEKQAVVFIVAALLLGAATKCYRDKARSGGPAATASATPRR